MTVLGQVFGYDVLSYGDPALGSFTVPGAPGVHLSLRADVAAILVNFAAGFTDLVEPLHPATTGGHNPRVIAGTTQWSRHAAGIAMDLNWSLHPQGKRGTFTSAQVTSINALLSRYTWNGTKLIRWGAQFDNPDEMHFEINVAPALARAAAAADIGGDAMSLEENLKPYNGVDIKLGTAIAAIYARTDYLANKLNLAQRLDSLLTAVKSIQVTSHTASPEVIAALEELLEALKAEPEAGSATP